MKLYRLILEMGAAKQCPNCGHPMAGYHYYYKGEWKCKSTSINNPAPGFTPTGVSPATAGGVTPTPAAPTQPPQTTSPVAAPAVPKQPVVPTVDNSTPPVPTTPSSQVDEQPLKVTMDIIAEAKPLLDAEILKINKTAAKIGANPVVVTIDNTYYKDAKRKDPTQPGKVIEYKMKMLTITVEGSTPRIKGRDGSTWDFVGIISPSATGQAILKLTPNTQDTPALRRLYTANPYFCDHCKKTRQRNETFIVQNGSKYRQVGRNCLKDFVGGANPTAILNFFAWFSDAAEMEKYFESQFSNSGGGGYARGGMYVPPLEILEFTSASVQHRGGYTPASGNRPTSADVRWLLFGNTISLHPEEKKDYDNMMKLSQTQTCKDEAKAVLDWFKAMPQSDKDANTFFKNIDIMVQEDMVESKQVGYIVGLYSAYSKANQATKTTSGVALIKEWDDSWGAGPLPVTDQHIQVNFVKPIQGAYGSSLIILIAFDDGKAASWRYSGQFDVHKGDEFIVSGQLEKDAYWTPPRIKFVPDRKWLRGGFKTQIAALDAAGNGTAQP